MATIELPCISSGNNNIKNTGWIRVTYEGLNGTIHITKLEGKRDSYGPSYGETTSITVSYTDKNGNSKSHSLSTPNVHTLGADSYTDWGSVDWWFGDLDGNVYFTLNAGKIGSSGTNTTFASYKENVANNPLWSGHQLSTVTINPGSTTRTSTNLNRSWNGDATECDYRIKISNNDWSGWIDENQSFGNITFSGNSVTGLVPNTVYNFQIRITNGWSGWKESNISTITTLCNMPVITSVNITPNIAGFIVNVTASGDENAPITDYNLYYKNLDNPSASSILAPMGTNPSITLDNIGLDTDYELYVTATNAGGTTTSSKQQKATRMGLPTIETPSHIETPFTSTVTVNAIPPVSGRTLKYQFSLDDSNWSEPSLNNIYTFDNLNEETEYTGYIKVTAIHSSDYGDDSYDTFAKRSYIFTTPADQARIRIKTDNGWIQGKMYYKINNVWVKAKKVYIKENNVWTIGKND